MNRQCLVSAKSVVRFSACGKGRLNLELTPKAQDEAGEVIVSQERARRFASGSRSRRPERSLTYGLVTSERHPATIAGRARPAACARIARSGAQPLRRAQPSAMRHQRRGRSLVEHRLHTLEQGRE